MTPIAQGGPKVDWLDEELRRDKALISQLRDTVDRQQVALVDQAQRIVSLEDRLARLQGQMARVPEVEQSLQHTRDEIVLMVSEWNQERQARATESLRARQAEREGDARVIQGIQLELGRFEPLEQAVVVRQAEDQRLNEALLRAQRDLATLTRRFSQTEDWRRQTLEAVEKNVVHLAQVTASVDDIEKAQHIGSQRLLSVEDQLPKYELEIASLQSVRQELTKQQNDLLETQRRTDLVRMQTMTEWGRKLEGNSHQMETWSERLVFFTDQHEKNRRVLRELQELSQEISQQQDHLKQVQRLGDEQVHRELREARSESDKRWAQEADRRDRALEEQARHDDAQDDRLTALDHLHEELGARLGAQQEELQDLRARLVSDLYRVKEAQKQAWHGLAAAIGSLAEQVQGSLGGEVEP